MLLGIDVNMFLHQMYLWMQRLLLHVRLRHS